MALSVAIEVPVALAVARYARPDLDLVRLLLVAVGATLITHPFAWAANERLLLPTWPRLGLIEISVALVEGVMFATVGALGWRRGLLAGLIANATSFGIGLLIYAFG